MQLHPAATLKIKGFKVVDALAADEAGPTVEVRVEQRRSAHLVRFLNHKFDGRASRSFDGEIGPADHLLGELKGQGCSSPAIEFDFP